MRAISKSEKKILISILSILIILCSLTYFSHRNSQRVIRTADEVNRSQEIKFQVGQVLASSVDVETSARGFVITGDEKYLETTDKAIETAFGSLGELKNIAKYKPALLKDINELSGLIEKKIFVSQYTIELRREKGFTDAVNFVAARKGNVLMNEIRDIANRLLKNEDELLQAKKLENRADIRNFNLTFDLLLVKIAITVLTVFFILRYYFKARNKAVHELHESKNLMQTILDNTAAIIFIKDLEGRYILINRQYEILFHKSKEALKGKTDYDVFPREIADRLHHNDMDVIQKRVAMEFGEDVPYNGEIKHYFSVKVPLIDENNVVYAVCGISTDITMRKQNEEEISRRSREIMDLFNTAPCGYQSTNQEGIITEMNDTLLKWLGYSRDEVVGKMMVKDMLSLESLPKLEYYFPLLKSGKLKAIHYIEAIYRRKDGTTFFVLANTVAEYDKDGHFTHTKTSIFDISLLKRAEALISQN